MKISEMIGQLLGILHSEGDLTVQSRSEEFNIYGDYADVYSDGLVVEVSYGTEKVLRIKP